MQKKITHIAVELIQNIKNYEKKIKSSSLDNYSRIRVLQTNDGYAIHSWNTVHLEDAALLNAKVSELNELQAGALKQLYLTRLAQQTSGDVGNGLGLIRIARLAAAPLQFHFLKGASDFGLLHFSIQINKSVH